MKKTFYLFPHQDDEVFVIPKISKDLQESGDVFFIFLTKAQDLELTKKRTQESVFFLQKLGADPSKIYHLGLDLNILDSQLCKHLNQVYSRLQSLLSSHVAQNDVVEIVTTAYEGGHHDHDAAFLLAQKLSQTFAGSVYEYFLYNGYKTSGKFYEVARPFGVFEGVQVKYTWADRYFLLLAPFIYRTQIKSLIGLWPFLFVKCFVKPLHMAKRKVALTQELEFDHKPLYERWDRITFTEFKIIASRFLEL